MGNIQDIIRIFSANILLAAKEDLSVKILAETLIINGLGGHQPIKEMTINNAVDYLAHHHKQFVVYDDEQDNQLHCLLSFL